MKIHTPNTRFRLHDAPGEAYQPQWALERVAAARAWEKTSGAGAPLIAVLDNPRNNYIPVSQQPLMDLRAAMDPPR